MEVFWFGLYMYCELRCILFTFMLQVFCGKLPNNVFEESLIPLFEKCGTIWDLRLMMDPATGYNKTFCFVTFTTKEGAQQAVKQVLGSMKWSVITVSKYSG